MPAGSARVEGIYIAVCKAIEGHGRTAGCDHAPQNTGQINPGKAMPAPCECGRRQCEGQCEQGMAESNQAHVFA